MESLFSLKKTLDLIGQQTVLHLKDQIKKGSFASGALHGSLRYEVEGDESQGSLSVYSNDTFFFVEGGRRKGAKMPPSEPLLEWIKKKGIPESALWPIRRSIAKKGITAKNYLRDWIRSKEASWNKLLGDSVVIDYTARFTERFRDLSPKASSS